MTRILLINGPNLNLLGVREPHIYGRETLQDVERAACEAGAAAGAVVECRQSNHEGVIVDWAQEARGAMDAIVLNAGAYTHTSVAIHDALRAFEGVIVELHVSNPHLREAFRHKSFVSPAATAIIAGFGVAGYARAVKGAAALVAARGSPPSD